jgi:transcriptional regulator with XRE-family HTH domain
MEMNLRALRKYRGVTQIQVSKLAEIAQPELSNAERRQDHLVSTLRRIVSAMGGELEVSAVFEDGKRIKLLGV